jgi:hypothetical protein
MDEPTPRLGDTIDDYCPRCRYLLNHNVASLVDGKVVKVVCLTCHSEHPYRYAEAPAKKAPSARAALFKEILGKAAPVPAAARVAPAPPLAEETPAPKKKKAAPPARYISRLKTRPPRGGR